MMLIFLSLALLGALFLVFGVALLLVPADVQRITREPFELMWGDRAQSFMNHAAETVYSSSYDSTYELWGLSRQSRR